MAKVVVCYKWVANEADIRVNDDLSVDLSKAKGKISDYDRNAIEAARIAGEAMGAEVVGLTFGKADAKQSIKDAVSRGLNKAYFVRDEKAGQADGLLTSNVLAAAIRKIEDYSLIICAEGAADTYARQIGPRLGVLLGLPVISCVSEIRIDGNKLYATRKLDKYVEKLEVELPAVIIVLPEINAAPIPGLKAVLAAGKKPGTEWGIADLDFDPDILNGCSETSKLKGYIMKRKNIIIDGDDSAEKVQKLVASLKREGVL